MPVYTITFLPDFIFETKTLHPVTEYTHADCFSSYFQIIIQHHLCIDYQLEQQQWTPLSLLAAK